MGSVLKKIRTSYKLSQQEVAEKLNISRNAYMAWENGQTKISMSKLQRICEVYKINMQELLIRGEKVKKRKLRQAI